MYKVEVAEVSFAHPDFEGLTEAEKGFLLVAGHIWNEVNVLNKLWAWSLPKDGKDGVSFVRTYQAFVVARLLAGTLNEAWKAIQSSYLNAGFLGQCVAIDVSPKLDEKSANALKFLKAYFNNKQCLVRSLRDDFGFHYSVADIGRQWSAVVGEDHFGMLLGANNGNTFHVGSELAVMSAMLASIEQVDRATALEKFFREVDEVKRSFSTFLDGSIFVLFQKARPNLDVDGRIEVATPYRMSDFQLPFFVAIDNSCNTHNQESFGAI